MYRLEKNTRGQLAMTSEVAFERGMWGRTWSYKEQLLKVSFKFVKALSWWLQAINSQKIVLVKYLGCSTFPSKTHIQSYHNSKTRKYFLHRIQQVGRYNLQLQININTKFIKLLKRNSSVKAVQKTLKMSLFVPSLFSW